MKSEVPSNNDRTQLVARLDGYLDAIASTNGLFRDYVMGAALLDTQEQGIEAAVQAYLSNYYHPTALVAMHQGAKWTEVERYLFDIMLSEPFGLKELNKSAVSRTRHELAFQATDMIMFLAENHKPKGIYHLVMAQENAESATGCVIAYEQDCLLVTHVHHPR